MSIDIVKEQNKNNIGRRKEEVYEEKLSRGDEKGNKNWWKGRKEGPGGMIMGYIYPSMTTVILIHCLL